MATQAGAGLGGTLSDGDELTVKLREDTLVCIHNPVPASPDPACAQFGTPPASPPKKGPIRAIESGIVRVPAGEHGALAVAVVVRAEMPILYEPETNADALAYAREYAGGVARSLGSATVRGAPVAEMWHVDGIPLIRFAFDLDGVPEDRALMQHHVGFAATARDARYTIVFSSRTSDATVIDAFANDSITSIQLPHRAPTLGHLVGSWAARLFGGAVALTLLVTLVVLLVRRRKARAQAGPRG